MRKTQPTSLPSLPLHHPSSTGNDPLRSSAPTHEHFPACPFPSAPKPLQHRFPYFFSLDGRSPVSHPTCEAPFPRRRSGLVSSRPARCTRGAVDRFGIPNPRKSGSVIGADRQRFGPSCVLLNRVPQGQTEATSAQRRCHPAEALYTPTFSHLFDCQ